ncbi:MAG: transposase [Candidatus Competibacter sp.]|nr:transposase [Candidatus Competibacter sp.]
MVRIPASKQTHKQIAEVLRGDFDKSALLRDAVRLIVEKALETEIADAMGPGYYERGEPAGYRNGNRLGRLKTAEGIVEFAVPQ